MLVVAPHPDDESLGCGGTLLRHRADGAEVHWVIVTEMSVDAGYSAERIAAREAEIHEVAGRYAFAGVHRLGLPTVYLDTLPMGEVVGAIAAVVNQVAPTHVYVPHRHDVHSDHTVVFDAVVAATKSFRCPSIRALMTYETLSETDFAVRPDGLFRPNLFVDVTDHLEEKLAILELYGHEMQPFPFPRSREAVAALAALRGTQAGVAAAEAFTILKEIRP
ncbi:PIG-L family deacetylase [Nocardioides sp.]|uniref:PIG-L deacetylase family protein n=1 Tax=Nocardioides sp. TaxID=35761 RepID=UPI002EDA238B